MKKNLTKLALSGAALAAVAATLGTSTYAWYTTNPTVSANNIVGASSDQGASSIYISKDTSPKAWSSEVTFDASDFSTAKLVPVQPADAYETVTVTSETFVKDGSLFTRSGSEGSYVYTAVESGEFSSGTTYYSKNTQFKKLDNSTAAATDVLSFSLWFKSSKVADEATADNGIDLYLKSLTISNSTDELKPADNLLYGDTDYADTAYGVTNLQPTYNVNFVKALGMRVVDVTDVAQKTKQTFELASFENTASTAVYGSTAQGTAANNFVTTGKAHAYYNQVMPNTSDLADADITAGKALTGKYTKNALTTLNATGTNDTARKLTFYIYLNGWNDFCYDACQGQQFTLNLQFTKVAGDARNSIA